MTLAIVSVLKKIPTIGKDGLAYIGSNLLFYDLFGEKIELPLPVMPSHPTLCKDDGLRSNCLITFFIKNLLYKFFR